MHQVISIFLSSATTTGRIYDAVSAARPATSAPITAEHIINKKGLSTLKSNKEIRWANMWSLLVLIQKLTTPHSKNSAINPVKKETTGVCGMSAATKKATTAILHQGQYMHAQKLKRIVRIIEIINFIFTIEFKGILYA